MSPAVLRRLVRARDLLHAEAQRGPTLDELAAEARLSRAHFARQWTAAFGEPPHQYLTRLRLEQAKRALATGGSVTEVCAQVGFTSLTTFSTLFHRRLGLSPRAWQAATRPVVQSRGLPVLFIPPCFLRYAKHV
ncbi:MAG: AraC family transcriptional regulator [Kofleriaceae bacterium]